MLFVEVGGAGWRWVGLMSMLNYEPLPIIIIIVCIIRRNVVKVAMACCKTSASLSSALVVGLILASCFFNGGESAQCMPDSVNPCRATCNGTSFDLSKAFDFP